MLVTALVWVLWSAIVSGALLTIALYPVSRLIGMAETNFAKLLFRFMASVASLQFLNIIIPFLLISSHYGWITDPDLILWLGIIGTSLLVIENLIVGWFAYWMYRRLNDKR